MHKSKLFTLLQGLKSEELRWFSKFLHSPFHNSDEQCIQLFDYIRKYHTDLTSPKLSKEATCKKLFPKEPFNVQKLRKVMHKLTLLTEDFLVEMRLREMPYQKKRLLVSELGKRNIYNLFEKGTEELREELEALPYRDAAFYLEQFQLKKAYLSHPQTHHTPGLHQSIPSISKYLDDAYFSEKLYLSCTLQTAKKIYKIDSELPFIEDFILNIEQHKGDGNITFYFYKSIYQIFKHIEKEELFKVLLDKFLKKRHLLSNYDQAFISKSLTNFSTYYLNRGRDEYVKVNFQLYKIGVKAGYLINNNRMSEATFRNAVLSGAFLKEFQWTNEFIIDYQKYLAPEHRKEIVLFNYATLYFHQGLFSKVIELLLEINFSKILYKIIVKTLLIKSYFELFIQDFSYHDLLLAQIDAFEKFIRREQQIPKDSQLRYLNFIKWVKKITYSHLNKINPSFLKNELLKFDLLSNKPWLLEKIEGESADLSLPASLKCP